MVKPGSMPLQPRAYEDVPKVAPTIQKFKPMSASGKPNAEKAAAMAPQYKCVDCGGHRVYGVGNPEKAKQGFVGQTFYFCKVCARLLTQEDRAMDNKRIAVAKLAARNELGA